MPETNTKTEKAPLPDADTVKQAFEPLIVSRGGVEAVFGPAAQTMGKLRGEIVPVMLGIKDENGNLVSVDDAPTGLLASWLNDDNAWNTLYRKVKAIGIKLFRSKDIKKPDGDVNWEEWLKYMTAPVFSPYGESLRTLQLRAVDLNAKVFALVSQLATDPSVGPKLVKISEEAKATNEAIQRKLAAKAEAAAGGTADDDDDIEDSAP